MFLLKFDARCGNEKSTRDILGKLKQATELFETREFFLQSMDSKSPTARLISRFQQTDKTYARSYETKERRLVKQ